VGSYTRDVPSHVNRTSNKNSRQESSRPRLKWIIKGNHGWAQDLVAPCNDSIVKGRCNNSLNKEEKHV